MKRFSILLTMILSGLPAILAQGSQVTGVITDISEQMRIPSVHILVQGSSRGTVSDAEGNFSIGVSGFPVTLYFSHVGYHDKEVRLYRPQVQSLVVRLEEKTNYLNEFTVYSPSPVNLIKDKPLYIWDYEFADDGILLTGTVNMNSWDRRLFLLTTQGDTIRSRPVRDPRRLFRDCLGINHLYDRQDVRQVEVLGDAIRLHYPTPIDSFEKVMGPVVGRSGDSWFVRHYFQSNQVLVYYRVDATSMEVTEFRKIEDELGLNILADRSRLESSLGYTEADRRFEEMCFYDEIFAPMVILGDSILIFNFVDARLEIYDADGAVLALRPMSFERDRHWEEDLLVDEATGRIYTLWERQGMTQLWEISIDDAAISRKIAIPDLPFVEKIKVRNDKVYFLFKPINKPFKQLYMMYI